MKERAVPRASGFWFRALLLAAAGSAFALITLGGVVRVTGSGLGCPDWPLCHGRVIPPLQLHTLIEYSHRLSASLVSILVTVAAGAAFWRYRRFPWTAVPVFAALAFLGIEVVLGGITVLKELPPTVVAAHLGVAEAIFGMLLVGLVTSWGRGSTLAGGGHPFAHWALAAALGTYAVILSGSYVVGNGATWACSGWPLCQAGIFPSGTLPWVHMAHRILAGTVGLVVVGVGVAGWRLRTSPPAVRRAGLFLVAAMLAELLAGAANPWFHFVPAVRALHLSLATATWGGSVVLAALAWRSAPPTHAQEPARGVHPLGAPRVGEEESVPGQALRQTLADYVALTKPRIMVLLLLTALGGMVLAAGGVPPWKTVLAVLAGGALASGGANALNHWLERDLDRQMHRTQKRPVANRRVAPGRALAFGVALNALAFLVLSLGANVLSALLAVSGTLFYILVYTRWLKPRTPQNIVIGGAAGALPPLVGWAAVTGGLGLPAFYLFAIVFFWTPPHFWALALLLRDDYARAGIPMLPVVMGEASTRQAILLYTLLLLVINVLFFLTTASLGLVYLVGASLLGCLFFFYALRLFLRGGRPLTLQLYKFSLAYLALLFAVVMADSLF
ncbi:MAG: protoheme IX farnesyltransferase [Chloroflexi bacterium]|nr:protoheme IX farnesyltransferase [Chloroflexota bacterium]